MLPTKYRLTRMKDFEILFKEGKFVGGKFVTVKIWKIDPEKYPRRKYTKEDLKIGFVVSKKIDKRAVIRNGAKRKMREVVRLVLKEEKFAVGFMVLIMAKKEILGVDYGEIERDVISVLKRARIFKD